MMLSTDVRSTNTYRNLFAFTEHEDSESGSSHAFSTELFSKMVPIVWHQPSSGLSGASSEIRGFGILPRPQKSTVTTSDRVDTHPFEESIQDSFSAFMQRVRSLPEWIQNKLDGVSSIDRRTIESAEQHIKHLHNLILDNKLTWTSPHITTDGEGDVIFEWWRGQTVLTIFVDPSGEIEYLRAWGPHIWNEMEECVNPTDQVLISLWQWLFEQGNVNG